VLTTAVFELVQQFYHAAEIGNVAIADKINATVSDKVNYHGTHKHA